MASNTDSQASALTQTHEGGGSYYLQQCMNVMKTFAEFSNLTYRITHTFKDVEVMTIYRNRLLGVFGPTVEPITLTIDPSGCCLVSVLFKPVKRVSLIESGSGGLDILSLLALLRMIAGKDYFFCPGLPEKFVSGKACGRYVELHRAPFKRFQSPQCPVYYKPKTEEKQKDQQESTDPAQKKLSESSIFKMCPQCRQVGLLVKRLPPAVLTPARGLPSAPVPKSSLSSNTQENMPANTPLVLAAPVPTATITATTSQPTITLGGQLISITMPSAGVMVPFQPIQPSITGTEVSPSLVTLPSASSLPALPLLQIGQSMNRPVVPQQQQTLPPPEKQNRQHVQPGLAKLAESLANKRIGQKELDSIPAIAAADPTVSSSVTLKPTVEEAETTKKRKRKVKSKSNKNVCKVCDKIFSTPASLLNHLQRHEGSLPKSVKTKLASEKKGSASKAVLRMMIRSAKKKSAVSETSLRLFSKCLDDLMASRSDLNSKPEKVFGGRKLGSKRHARQNKVLPHEHDTSIHPASSSKKLSSKTCKGRNDPVLDNPSVHQDRPVLEKRTSSGLSVQALLMAASLDNNSPGSPLVSSLSSNAPTSFDSETIGYSSRPASGSSQDETAETKQHRKSPRIASRRRKKELAELNERQRSQSNTPDTAVLPIIHNQLQSSVPAMRPTPVEGNTQPQVMHDPAQLANLDLLSTVSVDKAFREKNSPVPSSMHGGPGILNPQTCVNNSSTLQRVPNMSVPFSPLTSSAAANIQPQSASHPYRNLNHLLTKPSANPQDLRTPRPDLLPSPGVRGTIVPPPLFFARPGKDGRLVHPVGPMTPLSTNAGPLQGPVMATAVRPHGKPKDIFSASSQPMPPLIQTTQQGIQIVEHQAQQNYGAIDLSKPKPPAPGFHAASKQSNTAKDMSQIPSTLIPFGPSTSVNALPPEMLMGPKAANLAFPSLPVSQAKLPVPTILSTATHPAGILPNRLRLPEPAAGGLHQTNPVTGIREKQPVSTASIPHVHAMMMSQGPFPGQVLPPGKKVSSADEIQCGYKWSGSGGQVKERTQMVRELVPRDVMASFLNKQVQPSPVTSDDSKVQDKPNSSEPSAQDLSSPPLKNQPEPKPQDKELKSIPLSVTSDPPNTGKVGDHVSRPLALNLSKSKRRSEVMSEQSPSPARAATRAKKQKKGAHSVNKHTEQPDVVIIDVDQSPATSAMQSIVTAPSVSGSYPTKVRIRIDKSKSNLGSKDQALKPFDQSKVAADVTPVSTTAPPINSQVPPSKANSEPRKRGRGVKSFRQYHQPTLKTTATHSPSLAAILTQSVPPGVQGFSPPHTSPAQRPPVSDQSGSGTAALKANTDQPLHNGKQINVSRHEQVHLEKRQKNKDNSSNANSNASKYRYNSPEPAVTTAPCWVLLPSVSPVKSSGSSGKRKTSPAQAVKDEPVICISPPPPPLLHEGTEMITMALPVKKERRESEKKQRERDGSISPSKLVMDFQMDDKDNKKPIKNEGT